MPHTERANYPADLTDEKWQIIRKLLRPNSTPFKKAIDAHGSASISIRLPRSKRDESLIADQFVTIDAIYR